MSDDNGGIKKEEPKKEAPKDYKIAEIWVKEGSIMMDASPEFWGDKLRALGVLEMCKKIVMEFKRGQPQIITGKESGQFMNKLNRIKNRIGGTFGGKNAKSA